MSPVSKTNQRTSKRKNSKLPRITVKFAQSLDGRIATATADSQWISGPAAQRLAHRLRSQNDAILVGIGTVLADDPQLTVRLVRGRDPVRVIVDSTLRIPLGARVLEPRAARGTIIAATREADNTRIAAILDAGADVLLVPRSKDRTGIDLKRLLEKLVSRGIKSVLVEGGKEIITSLIAERLVDRLVVVIAPKIIGQGIEAIGDLRIEKLRNAMTFSALRIRRLGEDVVFDGELK